MLVLNKLVQIKVNESGGHFFKGKLNFGLQHCQLNLFQDGSSLEKTFSLRANSLTQFFYFKVFDIHFQLKGRLVYSILWFFTQTRKFNENNGNSDQWHLIRVYCFPTSHKWGARLKWVKVNKIYASWKFYPCTKWSTTKYSDFNPSMPGRCFYLKVWTHPTKGVFG